MMSEVGREGAWKREREREREGERDRDGAVKNELLKQKN